VSRCAAACVRTSALNLCCLGAARVHQCGAASGPDSRSSSGDAGAPFEPGANEHAAPQITGASVAPGLRSSEIGAQAETSTRAETVAHAGRAARASRPHRRRRVSQSAVARGPRDGVGDWRSLEGSGFGLRRGNASPPIGSRACPCPMSRLAGWAGARPARLRGPDRNTPAFATPGSKMLNS